MISTRNAGLDQSRSITTSKPPASGTSPDKTGTPGKPLGAAGTPTPTQVVAHMTGTGKLAPKTAINTPATNPGSAPAKSKPKESSSGSISSRTAARRDEHTNSPVAMPSGREQGKGGKGGGGGFNGSHQDARQEMHEWMPVSAQQSRITRLSPRTSMPHHLALPKTGLHAIHGGGLKSTVLSMFGKLYMDVMPAIFRRTPQEVDRNNRDLKKDAIHKSETRKLDRNHVRREDGRVLQAQTKAEPRRVMAGDLSTSFASA
jgi:hypothetical protein